MLFNTLCYKTYVYFVKECKTLSTVFSILKTM